MRAHSPKSPRLPKEKNNLTYLPHVPKAVPVKKRATSLLLVVVVLYFTVLFAGQYWRLHQLQSTLSEINQEISQVKATNEQMQKEVERLHSPDYLEQMAREELGMVRPGELLFYFENKDNH